MSTVTIFLLYLFVVFLMIGVFSIGIILGTELPHRLGRQPDTERILRTHKDTVKRIDGVIDYYVGLQQHIAERLDGRKK